MAQICLVVSNGFRKRKTDFYPINSLTGYSSSLASARWRHFFRNWSASELSGFLRFSQKQDGSVNFFSGFRRKHLFINTAPALKDKI